MPALRAIFFDIDDTLYSTTRFAEEARRAAIEAMIDVGLRADADELYHELLEVIHEFSANYPNHLDKLLLRIDPATYAGRNPALIVAAGVVAYHETKDRRLAPNPGVRELLKSLAQCDVVRGIITHGTTIKQAEKIVRLGIAPYLTPNAIFISDQVGISKPNVKLYARALGAVGVHPNEALYVGDNPPHDVDPPNRIGMWTVRLRVPGKHTSTPSETPARFEVDDFDGLAAVLRDAFGLPV